LRRETDGAHEDGASGETKGTEDGAKK
jgi:hypothetical protein